MTQHLVSCQVEGWRMEYSRCGNVWRNKEKQDRKMAFIDLEKAYDKVHRQEVWRRNREKGLPDNYIIIVQNMYEGAIIRVKPM